MERVTRRVAEATDPRRIRPQDHAVLEVEHFRRLAKAVLEREGTGRIAGAVSRTAEGS